MKKIRLLVSISIAIILLFTNYISAQNSPPEIHKFNGELAGFITLHSWKGSFTQSGGTTVNVTSSLGNNYVADLKTGLVNGDIIVSGSDTIKLIISNSFGSDEEQLVIPVYKDHNPLIDTLGTNDLNLIMNSCQQTGDHINFLLRFPLASFYPLYNFGFESKYTGTGINIVNFSVVDDSLSIFVDCNIKQADWSFKIQINHNSQIWFETGFVSLELVNPDFNCGLTQINLTPYYPEHKVNVSFYCESQFLIWEVYNHSSGITLMESFVTNDIYGNVDTTITLSANWLNGNNLLQGIELSIRDTINLCCQTFVFVMDNSSKANGIDSQNTFKIMPNPATNYLKLYFQNDEIRKITLFNLIGKLINQYETIAKNFIIDISHFPKGTYFLKVEENGEISVQKFVKL